MSRKMKDSGIEWIGDIPQHWETIKYKYVLNKRKEILKEYTDEDVLSLTLRGVIKRNLENPTGKMPASFDGYQKVYKNNLLLCLFDIDVTPRCVGVITEDGITSPAYSQYEIEDNNHLKFIYYQLLTIDNDKVLVNFTKSLRNTLTDLDFGALMTVRPDYDEQVKIANFLDEKTYKIDKIVEKTKQSIEELKAYKQSLITETVTKGLDPNVSMKDSGIEWVGDIPEHWNINMLSNYFYEVKNKNKNKLETNLLSLSYGNIVRKDINTTDGLLPASFENYNILEEGDIVLRMTDLQNDHKSLRTGYVNERGIITSAYITLRTQHDKVLNKKYVQLYLHSFDIHKGFYGMGAGVRQSVNYNDLKKLLIVVPPMEEQNELVEFLNERTSKINSLIVKKEQLINELESYKQSLVYEYVTGKKEVN